MRIGIIGGGAAGLASAWLLNDDHDVTLFEKDERLGGHAHTIEVEAHGQRIAVDAGFQFFAATPTYATFNRLLDVLEVPRQSYAATLTVHHAGRRHPTVLPPFRNGTPVWDSFTPRALRDMVRFRAFMAAVPDFLSEHDTTVTIEDYIARQRLPASFIDGFLYPLLLAFWCVELDHFRGFAAYNVLYYLGANLPKGMSAPTQSEVVGGLGVYVEALTRQMRRVRVLRGTGAAAIERHDDGYVIVDVHGERRTVDQVVVATNAQQALGLLESIPVLEARCRQLRRFEYFDTTIAIHGDRRLMPASTSAWSVVNARWDGAHSSLSIWDPRRGLPIFKSWVTYDERMPQPLYAVATYEHGKITPDYFDAQDRLRAMQGEHGVWLAGLYTHDADSHESAIRSAVTVAQGIAPNSPRLRRLLEE